jgi:putative hydrolase of the HAD superfamily
LINKRLADVRKASSIAQASREYGIETNGQAVAAQYIEDELAKGSAGPGRRPAWRPAVHRDPAIVFDLDNTLVDFMAMKRQAIDAAVHDGRRGPRFQHDAKAHRSHLWERHRVSERIPTSSSTTSSEARLQDLPPASSPTGEPEKPPRAHPRVPDAHGLLRGLRPGRPPRPRDLLGSATELPHIFHSVVTFDDTAKPHPAEPFRKALEMLGVKAQEALMVGDWAERDMIGAANIGMKTVFARYGDTFGTAETHADYEVADIKELLAIVERENGAAP